MPSVAVGRRVRTTVGPTEKTRAQNGAGSHRGRSHSPPDSRAVRGRRVPPPGASIARGSVCRTADSGTAGCLPAPANSESKVVTLHRRRRPSRRPSGSIKPVQLGSMHRRPRMRNPRFGLVSGWGGVESRCTRGEPGGSLPAGPAGLGDGELFVHPLARSGTDLAGQGAAYRAGHPSRRVVRIAPARRAQSAMPCRQRAQ